MSSAKLIITIAFFELQTLAYLIINWLTAARRGKLLLTAKDQEVALKLRSVWLYLSFVPYCLMIASDANGYRRMFRMFTCIGLNSLVAYRSFLKSPSTYPRPSVPAMEDALLNQAWKSLHAIDRPGNTFPSLHASHTFLLALMFDRHVPDERTDVHLLWANGIAISTLLTKQHYIVDITGGILAAETIATQIYQPWEEGRLHFRQALGHLRALCAQLDAMAEAPEDYRLPVESRHPRIAGWLAACLKERSFVRLYVRLDERRYLIERKAQLVEHLGRLRRPLAVANFLMPGWLQFVRHLERAAPGLDDDAIRAYLEELDTDLVQLLACIYAFPSDGQVEASVRQHRCDDLDETVEAGNG